MNKVKRLDRKSIIAIAVTVVFCLVLALGLACAFSFAPNRGSAEPERVQERVEEDHTEGEALIVFR